MFFHHDDLMTLAEEYRQVCAGETDMSLEDFITKHTIRTRERLIVSLCPRSLLYFFGASVDTCVLVPDESRNGRD